MATTKTCDLYPAVLRALEQAALGLNRREIAERIEAQPGDVEEVLQGLAAEKRPRAIILRWPEKWLHGMCVVRGGLPVWLSSVHDQKNAIAAARGLPATAIPGKAKVPRGTKKRAQAAFSDPVGDPEA